MRRASHPTHPLTPHNPLDSSYVGALLAAPSTENICGGRSKQRPYDKSSHATPRPRPVSKSPSNVLGESHAPKVVVLAKVDVFFRMHHPRLSLPASLHPCLHASAFAIPITRNKKSLPHHGPARTISNARPRRRNRPRPQRRSRIHLAGR